MASNIIELAQHANGVWRYADEAQAELAMVFQVVTGYDLTTWDHWLNDPCIWQDPHSYHQLCTLRLRLLDKYRRNIQDDEAIADSFGRYAEAFNGARKDMAGADLETKAVAATQARAKGGRGRRGIVDPLKAKVGDVLSNAKGRGWDFQTTLHNWVNNSVLDGVVCRKVAADKYEFTDDGSNAIRGTKAYTRASLKTLFSRR